MDGGSRSQSRPYSRTSRRAASLFVILTAALIAVCGGVSEDSFNGTILKNAETAPDFTLTNQFGKSVRLDRFRGRVVALTFLYTNCPDVCPIVTAQLRETSERLGADLNEVQFVVVSVDPERDSVESAREYLDKWGLLGSWQFLVGDRSALEDVWGDYYVAPNVSDHDPLGPGEASQTVGPRGAIDSLSEEIVERYLVAHSTPVFLIDKSGKRRVVFTPPLEPEEVAGDIRRLLAEGAD